MGKNVIVACDFSKEQELQNFLRKMDNSDDKIFCKVGMELFYSGILSGFNPINIIKSKGHKVFLDLKLKDIPNTVSSTSRVLMQYGVDMINVHADGGLQMMREFVDSINQYMIENPTAKRPILLGVTVLTSISNNELVSEINVNSNLIDQVVHLARLSKLAGLDGVVCSPEEILAIKDACTKDFITVTPGVRFDFYSKDDQSRIATPICANIMGGDYIVVGRPITRANDPLKEYELYKAGFTQKITCTYEIEKAKKYIESIKNKYYSVNGEKVLKI